MIKRERKSKRQDFLGEKHALEFAGGSLEVQRVAGTLGVTLRQRAWTCACNEPHLEAKQAGMILLVEDAQKIVETLQPEIDAALKFHRRKKSK